MSNPTYLIDYRKNCYKANLHCHSTISDGEMTPEELKKYYKNKGYSILSYTDHEVLVPHNELNDEDFLALPGYEVQVYGDMELPKRLRRVSHMNFYPKNPENRKMPFYKYPKYDLATEWGAQIIYHDNPGEMLKHLRKKGLHE